ncbi:penicillin-binding protein activator [Bauldia sp.]|uniref:penicillin-binding protein activator n=1 Tax=Bauldia sp. TaxID=2575872 RepID=UPI0025BC996F|nr:penicillin-binding protein activator [Bauldia sp.]
MSSLFRLLAGRTRVWAIATAGVILAACSPSTMLNPPATGVAGGPVAGETLGTGPVRVAMLLPLSATGNAGQLARDMRNAAELALREFQAANIQILIKDDRGTADGARAAATAAISEGAQIILGPVFSEAVRAAGSVARPAKIPVVAFSTDTTTAAKGVYLISFLPQSDVDRIIRFAASQGRNSYAALLPANAYGTLVEATLQKAVASTGGRVVASEKYNLDRNSMQSKATAIAGIVKQGTVNAVFIPDSGDATPFLAQVLAANGVSPAQIKFLGSGQWDDPRIIRESNLNGGWFPGPDLAGFQAFSQRYKAAYGSTPVRNASLAYDAVSLAAGLSGRFGTQAFTEKVLTTPSGFVGVDGPFRFLANGTNQRALAVYQIERGQLGVVSPPPKNFSAGF